MYLPNISNKIILISVLDWGVGHLTRCVPIIQNLIESNNRIIFAGNLWQMEFVRKEFSTLHLVYLEGYNIELSSQRNTYFQVFNQIFKINKSIQSDRRFVDRMIKKHQVDLVLSDNRYGFRHTEVESIFIGHQLNLQIPSFKNLVNHFLNGMVNQFSSVWILDDKILNLAGQLSDPKHLNVPFHYIGLPSRFDMLDRAIKYKYLFIISGPKPENAIFLNEVERLIINSNVRCAIVSTVESSNRLSGVDYFYDTSTEELNVLLNVAEVVISKSGYTTLMELISLNKNAILIPTKGQYEQEYLASHIKNESFQFVNTLSEIKNLFN